jgi:hypothetical protein
MEWSQVRSHYPSQWVLVEAIEASTIDRKRVIEQMSVVDSFGDNSIDAMKKYLQLHKENKERELYVVHTSRDHLDIEVTTWTGARASI